MGEYICGFLCGGALGVVVMALFNVGARADECAECRERQNRYMAAVRARQEDRE